MPLGFPSHLQGLLAIGLLFGGTVAYTERNSDQQFDLDAYWRRPLMEQGEPPPQWNAAERSLAPEACGQCHGDVLAQWLTSRHAHAFSPGIVGQLLDMDAASVNQCMKCHAPLAEQREAFESARGRGVAQSAAQQGLAAAGNSCGGCHLRGNHRFGPPQRVTGETGPSPLPAPHDGAFRTTAFEQAEFCSSCHQFAAGTAVNGKPLENTYMEWLSSPQAAEGKTCQTCHMPDRAHLWRGIHDPAMVVQGLTPRFSAGTDRVRFELTNSGVGHAVPTYAVPTIVMNVVALDADGAPLTKTLQSHVIARRVHYDNATNTWHELSDTRLLPGQSAAVELAWNGSDRIRAWLEVIPDDFYQHEFYPALIAVLAADSAAQKLIRNANADASASSFRLFETELRRP
jgi:hypothetical protein